MRARHQVALRIFDWFASRGDEGSTTDECETALNLRHQSVSPRVHELHRGGCLVATEEKRVTRGNKFAVVYRHSGLPFGVYVRTPPLPRMRKTRGLSLREQDMLAAASSYVRARGNATTRNRVRPLAVKLLRILDGIAKMPEDD